MLGTVIFTSKIRVVYTNHDSWCASLFPFKSIFFFFFHSFLHSCPCALILFGFLFVCLYPSYTNAVVDFIHLFISFFSSLTGTFFFSSSSRDDKRDRKISRATVGGHVKYSWNCIYIPLFHSDIYIHFYSYLG